MFDRSAIRNPLTIIAGPTASGKTAVALELARRWGAGVVSADSQQVVRGMDIGTATPDAAEIGDVDYSGHDLAEFSETFDAARFAAFADSEIERHQAAGSPTIVVGGTGLYIRALVEGLFDGPSCDPAIRAELEARIAREGGAALHAELAAIDPEAAATIHPNDPVRLIRALEVWRQTGRPISDLRREHRRAKPRHPYRLFVLDHPREALYRRIEARTRAMLEAGWLGETQRLRECGFGPDAPAAKALGYLALLEVLDGNLPLEDAIARIQRDSRRYAKRQITWFRGRPDTIGLDAHNNDATQLARTIEDRLASIPPVTRF